MKIKTEVAQKRSLSVDFIKEINAAVMKSTGGRVNTIAGSFNTAEGDLRLAQVYVDEKYFPDFSNVLALLENLISNINRRVDKVQGDEIVKLAADIHYNLVNIHPFGDGNGRTSRLFMNYIQRYHNVPLIKIFTEDRAEYIDALNETEEKEDMRVFRNFICRQQIKFYEAEITKFQKGKPGFSLLFEKFCCVRIHN